MPATPRLLPLLLALAAPLAAQEPTAPATPAPATPAPPPGQVLSAAPTTPAVPADVRPDTPVTDAERTSIEIQSLLLDLHLTPAEAREEAHATLTLHNLTAAPLARIPLQLSSTLHWLSASVASAHGLQPIPFTQSPVATDADHTGYAEEAVFTPAQPLAPHATLTLTVVYGGAIKQTADRLELIGVPQDKALASDWDQIASTSDAASTSLRGFGNVLWYPCAAPLVLFGQGNQLFDAISRERRHNLSETMRLRLTVNYVGDPPDAVLFNGQLQALTPAPDGTDTLVNDTQGIATAVFPADSSPADSSPAAPIGLRTPSLFLTAQQPTVTPGDLLTVVTPIPEAIGPYSAAVKELEPLLTRPRPAPTRARLSCCSITPASPLRTARSSPSASPPPPAPDSSRRPLSTPSPTPGWPSPHGPFRPPAPGSTRVSRSLPRCSSPSAPTAGKRPSASSATPPS